VGDKRANGAKGMGGPALMVMECKSRDGETEAYGQEIEKFPVHQPMNEETRINTV
jgi:hypothetical protein